MASSSPFSPAVGHVAAQIQQQNSEQLEPVFDPERSIGSTHRMCTLYTTKPCLEAVVDSTWEHYSVTRLEQRAEVIAYAKNDHLGLQILYLWWGSKRRFLPDFVIRLANGKTLIVEIKGEDSEQNRAKRMALDAWVRAVNARGGFGVWCWDVVKGEPSRLDAVIKHHARTAAPSEPIGE